MTVTDTVAESDLDNASTEVQLATVLRILERLSGEVSPEHIVELVTDFRTALREEDLAVVDSDEVTEHVESILEEMEQDQTIGAIFTQLFGGGLGGRSLEDFFGVGFLEAR